MSALDTMPVASRPDVRAFEAFVESRNVSVPQSTGLTVRVITAIMREVWLAACAWQRAFDADVARHPQRQGIKGAQQDQFEVVARAIEAGVG